MLTLVLMIVLSSFSIVFAAEETISFLPIPANATSFAKDLYNSRLAEYLADYDYVIAISHNDNVKIYGTNNSNITQLPHLVLDDQYYYITNTNSSSYVIESTADIYWPGWSDNNGRWDHGLTTVSFKKDLIYFSNFNIYGTDYVDSNNKGSLVLNATPYITNVSIKPSQRILFNYAAADKDKFLKSLSCTPKKSITVHQAYYSGGQVTDMVIKKDTTDLFIGGSPLTLSSFPSHRVLNTNEYLGYSQANGGNWVWTDYIPGSSGGPVGTDSNSLVTFTIDTRYCSYRVVSANTGLEITSGGIADIPQVPDDGIYNNNQNPWGPGDITDDYLLDRADYEDGIIGDIQYGFDTLFKFLKMPFELLYKFIMTLGEIIQYALGTVSGFTTALQGIYAILPSPIWFLVIMAISINVFKLIFGR